MSYRQILWCVLLALLAPGALMLMGNMQGCLRGENLIPSLTDIEVTVPLGGSAFISNPSLIGDGEWMGKDGLYLLDPPEGLSVVTDNNRSPKTRKLSAEASIAPLTNEPVSYVYLLNDGTPRFSEGQYLITTGTALSASAMADPTPIEPGETSVIDLTVTGGSGNNTYEWSPADDLNDPTLEDPEATPPFTRTYTVEVTDNNTEQTATASVKIEVNTGLTVTATPPAIDPGSSSQLSAVLSGAEPPVDYSWTPADSLDDATIQSPLASPTVNTTYEVTATDSSSGGTPLSGQVTVTVNLTAVASATPDTINEGNTSQLLAAVQGGEPPYTFAWTPNIGLNADNVANPIASPTTTTSYTVGVDDSATAPQTSSDSVTVTVIPLPGGVLNACFTTIAGTPLVLDAGCTDPGVDGPIAQYCWWFNWDEEFRGTFIDTPAGASFCSTTQATANLFGEPGSAQIVRLRVEDSAGALAEDIQTVVF